MIESGQLVMKSIITMLLFALTAFAQAPASAPAAATADDKFRTELDRAQKTLKDWANLGRYKAENASAKPPAAC